MQNDTEKIDKGISILDYLLVLAKNKKLILFPTIVIALLTVIYALVLPNTYISQTTILLPQQKNSVGSGLLSQLGLAGIDTGSGIQDPRLFQLLLTSIPVYDRIIERFSLLKDNDSNINRVQVRKKLSAVLKIEFIFPKSMGMTTGREISRMMRISVSDKDPNKAADMTNAFVEELKSLLKSIAVTNASQQRLFFGEQLKKATHDLIEAEETMKIFQEDTGMLKVQEQATSVIESIAKLHAEIASKEVELKVMKTYSTTANPDLQIIEETINGLKIELDKLEKKGVGSSDMLITAGRMPSVGLDYMRNMRTLKFNETLYELMIKQYKMAMIDEAKDPSLIQVINRAVPTELRAGPHRRKMVIKATVIVFIFFIFVAFLREYLERRKAFQGEDAKKVELLKKHLSFKDLK